MLKIILLVKNVVWEVRISLELFTYLFTSLEELPRATFSWPITASHKMLSGFPFLWISSEANNFSAMYTNSAQKRDAFSRQDGNTILGYIILFDHVDQD